MKNALALISHPAPLSVNGAFVESQYKSRARSGEQKLVLALLEDGIDCFFRYLAATDDKGREIFEETDKWIFENNSDWVFSFENVCETLGINTSYLRAKLRRWKELELLKRGSQKGKLQSIRPHSISSQQKIFVCEHNLAAAACG